MADIGKSVREFLLQSVKAVNSAANSVASTTRYKVDELNLQNRRKELLSAASDLAYTLWKGGEPLPESLASILEKVASVDADLASMRENRKQEVEKAKAEKAAAKEKKKEEAEAAPVLEVPEDGPYAQAAQEQADAEVKPEDIEEQIDDAIDGIKQAVKDTADAIDDAVDALKGDAPEKEE